MLLESELPPALHPLPYGPFKGLTCRGASALLVDVPLDFATWSANGAGRSPSRHYQTMSYDECAALPIEHLAGRDSFLFMWWWNWASPAQAERIMHAWGFRYSGVFLTWVKLNPSGRGFHRGKGFGSAQNTERVLLGRRGSPRRVRPVNELLFWPRYREHSRKPPAVRGRIMQFCNGPYLELFARDTGPGWVSWGDQRTMFDAPGPAAAD